jgi:NAD(P)-dependent dehydrogenase (short-subunit alcohol dehydrogenase family)
LYTELMSILKNRVAIITGGARGIGLALSQVMVMQGAKVIIADNGCAPDGSPEDSVVTQAAVQRCNQIAAGSTIAFTDNIATEGAPELLVALAKKQFGYIDILINNAAVVQPDHVLAGNRALFEFILTNNLTSAYHLTTAVAAVMREQVQTRRIPGSIVNVMGAAGIYGDYDHTAYSVANSGLLGLTRSTALQLKSFGINCNAVIAFAGTRQTGNNSQLNSNLTDPDTPDYVRQTNRIAPTYAANLLAWIASPQAASITGQLLGVRGREVLLFNQSRPTKSIFTSAGVLDADALAHSVMDQFTNELTDLLSAASAWSGDPIL